LLLDRVFSYSFHSISFERFLIMQKEIHPKYEDATISCACGNVIKTRSTKKEMSVNTCSACHPYFTGQQTMVDTEGRVDSFMKRYNMKKA
jgi:large subunit ribosomal protein L31